jgi:SAM-dependent methyltransferase
MYDQSAAPRELIRAFEMASTAANAETSPPTLVPSLPASRATEQNVDFVFEEALVKVATVASRSSMLQSMMEQLDGAVYRHGPSNAAQNSKLWDLYAKEYATHPKWLQDMAAATGQDIRSLPQIGCEWSDAESLAGILENWLLPHMPIDGAVAEIACGGGRIAAFTVQQLFSATSSAPVCFVGSDVSQGMISAAQTAVDAALGDTASKRHASSIHFMHTPSGTGEAWATCIAGVLGGAMPLRVVLCFDAMVHMEPQVQFSYLRAIAQRLAPGGVCLLSTANMTSPLGWRRFVAQERTTVAGFVWSSPDATRHMLQEAGLTIVRESCCPGQAQCTTGNLYLDRDYVVLAQKQHLLSGEGGDSS